MDAATHFTLDSEPFTRLVGPQTAALFGRPWAEIAARLKLDPTGEVARALAARNTWSGLIVLWPLADGGDRLPVEMSGLPVFDRDRNFSGFRGFGVCRDVERFTAPLRELPPAGDDAQRRTCCRSAPRRNRRADTGAEPVEHTPSRNCARTQTG